MKPNIRTFDADRDWTLEELAESIGIGKSPLLRYVKSRGLPYSKSRPPGSNGSLTVVFTREQANKVIKQRQRDGFPIPLLNKSKGAKNDG